MTDWMWDRVKKESSGVHVFGLNNAENHGGFLSGKKWGRFLHQWEAYDTPREILRRQDTAGSP